MSSNSQLNVNSIDALSQEISQMEDQIQQVFGPHSNLPKIILVGNTGSGKSSLLNSLANQSLIVAEGIGRRLVLNGQGVMAGGNSITRQPTLLLDPQHRFILCDCPGFEDTGGINQEIINAFIIDYLFKSDPNSQNKFKVLLVASASELESQRGQVISTSVDRLYKMIIDRGQLQRCLGLVITKGKNEISGRNHIEFLMEDPHPNSVQWISYFHNNLDHVFVMPEPQRENIGQNYQFQDKNNLINFLMGNYMINPKHKIILSEAAANQVDNLQLMHGQHVAKVIEDLFALIILKYKEEETSESFQKWKELMEKMRGERIDNSKDLRDFITENIPNNGEFEKCFKTLENYEKFDTFIKNAIDGCGISLFMKESIDKNLQMIHKQITILMHNKKIIEQQRDQIITQLQTIEEQKKESEEHLKMIQEQGLLIEKANEDNQHLSLQIHDMKLEIQHKQREMELIIQNLSQRNDNGSLMQNLMTGFFAGVMTSNKVPFFNLGASSSNESSKSPTLEPKK